MAVAASSSVPQYGHFDGSVRNPRLIAHSNPALDRGGYVFFCAECVSYDQEGRDGARAIPPFRELKAATRVIATFFFSWCIALSSMFEKSTATPWLL
jgi:hypothetical protein